MIYFLIHDAIHWLCVSVRLFLFSFSLLVLFIFLFLSFIPAQTISLRAIAKHSAGHVTEDIKRTKPERPVLYTFFYYFYYLFVASTALASCKFYLLLLFHFSIFFTGYQDYTQLSSYSIYLSSLPSSIHPAIFINKLFYPLLFININYFYIFASA